MSLNRCREFTHNLLPKYTLERIHKPDGRYYVLPSGRHVQSVTTILSSIDSQKLDDWKRKVGIEQANRISTQAKIRGSAVHLICEKYLLNDVDYKNNAMPFNLSQFKQVQPYLDKHCGTIYGIEYPLFSEDLNAAGTTDLICQWNGVNSIVDFKTSKNQKTEQQIEHYFIQATCYAMMAEQIYDIEIPNIAILIMVDHDQLSAFVHKKDKFIDKVYSIFKNKDYR